MFDEALLISELTFKAIRSSGAGGQHVNKVASKVVLNFNLKQSEVFSEAQKNLLLNNLSNRLTTDGILILQSDESRSQHKNKELVVKRFLDLIKQGLKVPKKRKPTKIPKAVKLKRLSKKKQQADKKANRKPPEV
ncbi:MAG: aminoacyl-tRNA hydrolase [Xanthomarina sp.]|jgi:ribosome-associated protein|uniref:alternative ribosome rescue aminoacyl-tRNA hydrolase ArfB n=1 Tax=Xanthomarina TaxID=1868329 RepID=UPI000C6BEED6|nr:alternative ribosome rescue aminoacyl-tRNA hydrolase ArfB [Xanthomarina sp.]MAL22248.1 aminoacyl-tRNA hydrolase [Xanthomarina sp.]MBF60786.1 aminoacyl-tRNA hydrolase [Xanthomarina sp.]MCB0387594.1 aminoacyl-tRNA hydrolase [Winogradskyella sp.]HAI17629.1 aminoacyl-tRNA hydrolase [Xanthomarina gelatinilytica]|tara:strand:+ start:2070 stop:2474 length:405 start_codon:yes stop_codon:yes gene_type:complete